MGDTSVVSRVGSIRERSRGVGAHQESILVDDRRGEDAGLGVGDLVELDAAAAPCVVATRKPPGFSTRVISRSHWSCRASSRWVNSETL